MLHHNLLQFTTWTGVVVCECTCNLSSLEKTIQVTISSYRCSGEKSISRQASSYYGTCLEVDFSQRGKGQKSMDYLTSLHQLPEK